MNEVVIPQKDSYVRHWLITIALVAGVWFAYDHLTRPNVVEPVQAMHYEQGVSWFYVLRMPPVTSQYESGIETMKVRYSEWLEALKAAGYTPILFSDLRRMSAERVGIPPKSVVLMFSPGFRRTYHIVSPILEKHKWSAVWMSDEDAMETRHREYISYRTARQMVASGIWDVGLKKKDGTYKFNIGQKENFQLGQRGQSAWVPTSGGLAFNNRTGLFGLNYLNINPDWLASDLVNRLNAELPVEGPVYFNRGEVQNLIWGMTQPHSAVFDLAAEPQQKSAIISWLGTRGIDNCKIKLRGRSLAGTLSLRLRWDETTSSGIQISVLNNKLTVQDWKEGESRIIYKAQRASWDEFSVAALLVGDRLAISIDNGPAEAIPTPVVASSGKGVTQIYLRDGVLGAARAKSLQIHFEPLPQSAVVFTTGGDIL